MTKIFDFLNKVENERLDQFNEFYDFYSDLVFKLPKRIKTRLNRSYCIYPSDSIGEKLKFTEDDVKLWAKRFEEEGSIKMRPIEEIKNKVKSALIDLIKVMDFNKDNTELIQLFNEITNQSVNTN